MARETQAELTARLSAASQHVTVGARYRHYKQRTYMVVALALREEDSEPCVVYRAEYGDRIVFIRPVANWLEAVTVDGMSMPRFTKI